MDGVPRAEADRGRTHGLADRPNGENDGGETAQSVVRTNSLEKEAAVNCAQSTYTYLLIPRLYLYNLEKYLGFIQFALEVRLSIVASVVHPRYNERQIRAEKVSVR